MVDVVGVMPTAKSTHWHTMSGSKRKLEVLHNDDPTPERVVVEPGITVGDLATMLKKRNKLNDDCAVKLEACSAGKRTKLNLKAGEEDRIEDYIGEDESVLMSWTKAAVSQEPQAAPAHVTVRATLHAHACKAFSTACRGPAYIVTFEFQRMSAEHRCALMSSQPVHFAG